MSVIARVALLPALATLCLALAPATAPATAQAPPESGPCADEPHRRLDFWVGEWRVVDAAGRELGRNRIELAEEGCLLVERWSSARGGTGRSMNYHDPASRLWRQTWVAASGGVVRYEGDVVDGTLRYEGIHIRPDGSSRAARAMIEPLADGRLHHVIEHSEDGGASWTIVYFDAFYEPLGGQLAVADRPATAPEPPTSAPEPTAPPRPLEDAGEPGSPAAPAATPETTPEPVAENAPSPEAEPTPEAEATTPAPPPTGDGVRALSPLAAEESLPAERRQRIEMASPMTLEVELGPLHRYPDDSAWGTDETAGYASRGVVVRRLEVARRSRRGEVVLEARLHLLTDGDTSRVGAAVELLAGDEVVASAARDGIVMGFMVAAYDPEEGLRVDLPMTLERERFEEIFARDHSPSLRVRLTVSE